MAGMTYRALYFTEPYRVELREGPLPSPGEGEVRVTVALSGISAGTEMLIYRGLMPRGMETDMTLPALRGKLTYPLKYGYACVGWVDTLGPGVSSAWLGRWVFAFQPHQSHFVTPIDQLFPLPEDIPPDDALFLPNMETAVNFLMDGRPTIGERVVVLGQGVVGLLTTALLSAMPLARLVTVDKYESRLRAARELGAHHTLRADTPQVDQRVLEALNQHPGPTGADLVYELSGTPEALNTAIAVTGFGGRIIVGSWYGNKRGAIDLGGHFHRSRIHIVSSQVSTIAPEHTARWDKPRRLAVAWHRIAELHPSRLITHRFPAHQAQEAYRLIDEHPEHALQVILEWTT